MKAKLLLFILITLFSSTTFAEYYLVYPVANVSCGDCYYSSHRVRHRIVHHRKVHHQVRHHRYHRRSCYASFHRPCAGVVRCSACGEYVNSRCGRPDYLVYSAAPRDCVTYEGVEMGERYDP